MKSINIDNNNYSCIIGNNAQENWQILSEADDNDLFFHLTSFPSCYVICKINDNNLPNNDIIKQIAILCKQNTKYKNIRNIKVDYTECKNIIKGEKVGEVIYKSNRKVKKITV